MTSNGPLQKGDRNWAGVALGAVLLAFVVFAIGSVFLRVVAAVGVLALTFYLTQVREANNVADLSMLSESDFGLDRRKYGRLRDTTNQLLDNVRRMNQIGVDARAGKITQRHANAELDRLAAVLRDLVPEIRKAAGIPTPVVQRRPTTGRVISPANRPVTAEAADSDAQEQKESGPPVDSSTNPALEAE